jgi:RNA polymerase sigma factor (sigma-70 family)
LDDLLQAGRIGLLEAVRRFDPNRGVPFWTYAQWRVLAAIQAVVCDHRGVPDHIRKALTRIHGAGEQLTQEQGREPTTEEIADRVGLPPEKVEAILAWPPQRDEPPSEEGEETPELEIPDVVEEPLRKLLKEEARRVLLEAIARLPDHRDRVLVTSHHLDEIPINTIAQTLWMTDSAARKRLDRARERLRMILEGMDWTCEELLAALRDP